MYWPRPAAPQELDALADVWYDCWHESHAKIVPFALVLQRDWDQFRARLAEFGAGLFVIGPKGRPHGLCVAKDGFLDQLFVRGAARGTGDAARLLAAGEALLLEQGVQEAKLHCANGNDRARRFYEKQGWRVARTEITPIVAAERTIMIDAHVMVKTL